MGDHLGEEAALGQGGGRGVEEQENLADDTEHAEVQARLEALLESEHSRLDDPHPLVVDEKASMEFDYESIDRVPDQHQPDWVVRKYF